MVVTNDGHEYYKMVLVYVDDIMVISHVLRVIIEHIGDLLELKPGSLSEPDHYLGLNLGKFQLVTGEECWYTGAPVANWRGVLVHGGQQLCQGCSE